MHMCTYKIYQLHLRRIWLQKTLQLRDLLTDKV
uniref:Uncharacterized protein n=1 Tax=Anguilla anguilla TaxID=7936 RepID=A0A0E9WD70_ANGAN